MAATLIGNTVYMMIENSVSSPETCSFQVADISDPRKPILMGSIQTGSRVGSVTTGFCSGADIDVQGDRAYVAGFNRLEIMDVSDPFEPNSIGGVDFQLSSDALAVHGNNAYVRPLFQ